MNTLYSVAFFTGLVSSLHCVGMCGPIALALPVGGQSVLVATINRILYNVGRILTYSIFGAIWGFFGKTIHIAGLQKELSIIIGLVLLIYLLPKVKFDFPFKKIVGKIITKARKMLDVKSSFGFLLFGIINGLLPCGMVYIALAGSAISSSPVEGSLIMAFFGMGTAPLMFSISVLPRFLTQKSRKSINKYLPIYTIFLAILFIFRGLYQSNMYQKVNSGNSKHPISICKSQKI